VIGYLRGRLLSSTPEILVLDVGGVGYEVNVPLPTYYEVERAGEAEIGLHIRTHMREGSITLFGFWSERERLLFDKLLGVGGIGPKLARLILSGTPPGELIAAIAAGDIARLSRTPGVGKKTAERMVVELKDKVEELAADLPDLTLPSADTDLVMALLSLGYKQRDAEAAAAAAEEELGEAPLHELLRVSLGKLSRA